jgi:hypothetical protein
MEAEAMTPQTTAQDMDQSVLALVRDERAKALSSREWKFRLRGHGFAVRDENGTQVLTKLPRGEKIGVLPPEFT